MDKLYSMQVFQRVIDTGSFAAAARDLDMAPASVTRAVAALEEEVGVRLIQRTTRRLSLTSVGEIYLEHTRAILKQVKEVDALAAASVAEPKGRLRVLVPNAFAVHQLIRRLPLFRSEFPLVSIEMTTGGCHDPADDAYDVSIQLEGGGWTLNNEFVARKFASSEVFACVAPEVLHRQGNIEHPGEFAERDCLTYNLPGYAGIWELLDTTRSDSTPFRVEPRQVLTTPDPSALLSAAIAQLGYIGLPSFMVDESLRNKALVRVLPQWHVLTYGLYAVLPNRKYVPAATRAFINFLMGSFGGADQDPWAGDKAGPRRVGAGARQFEFAP